MKNLFSLIAAFLLLTGATAYANDCCQLKGDCCKTQACCKGDMTCCTDKAKCPDCCKA